SFSFNAQPPAEFYTLSLHDALPISWLAGRLSLAKPTVSAAVDGLVERGLLVREAVAGDRRAVRLGVTPAGRKQLARTERAMAERDRKSTRLNSSHVSISYAVFCLKK